MAEEFDAFISYAHAADGSFGPALKRTLESLAKAWYQRRAISVFLDNANLSANPKLWSAITDNLEATEWLVVLCSPEAAASPWVGREIEWWLEHKGSDRIILVLTGGSLAWSELDGDFTPSATHAAPAALSGVFDEEPRHIDLRWARDAAARQSQPERFRDQVADVAAPIRGVAKSDLVGEDLRQHRRTMRMAKVAVAVLSVLVVVAVIAALVAVDRAGVAREERATAIVQRDKADHERLVAQARALASSDPALALLLALEAGRQVDDAASRGALLSVFQQRTSWLGSHPVGGADRIGDAEPIDDQVLAWMDLRGRVGVSDLRDGTDRWTALPGDAEASEDLQEPAVDTFEVDGRTVVAASRSDRESVWLYDADTGELIDEIEVGQQVLALAVGEPSATVVVGSRGGDVRAFRALGGGDVGRAPAPVANPAAGDAPTGDRKLLVHSPVDPVGMAFDPRGEVVAIARSDGTLELWDPSASTLRWRSPLAEAYRSQQPFYTSSVVFSPDGERIVQFADDQLYERAVQTADGTVEWSQVGEGLLTRAAFISDGALAVSRSGGQIVAIDPATGLRQRVLGRSSSSTPSAMWLARSGREMRFSALGGPRVEGLALDGSGLVMRHAASQGTRAVDLSEDLGLLVASAPTDNPLILDYSLWNSQTGAAVEDRLPVLRAALAGDDRLVAFFEDLTGGLYDLRTRRRVGPSIEVALDDIYSYDFSPSGDVVALTRSDGTLDLYRIGDDAVESSSVDFTWPLIPSFRDDGRRMIASFADGSAAVLDERGQTLVEATPGIVSASYVGSEGAIYGSDTTGLIRSMTPDLRWQGPALPRGGSEIFFISGSTDGTLLMSQDATGAVQLYDLTERALVGEQFQAVDDDAGRILSVLSAGGNFLAVSVRDGIQVWDLTPARWRQAACIAAGRNLTMQEWDEYLPNAGAPRRTCPDWPPPA